MSNSLWPRGLQHARPPCPSPTLGACSNSCPSSRWGHPTISSSVVPFSSCPQCFPASGSFPMSQLFTSGGQSIRASASASVLPMNTQYWSPLDGLVGSPCSPRDSQESSPTPQFKSSILWCSAFFIVQLSHPYMTTGKTVALTRRTFVGKIMSLLFKPSEVTLLFSSGWLSSAVFPLSWGVHFFHFVLPFLILNVYSKAFSNLFLSPANGRYSVNICWIWIKI